MASISLLFCLLLTSLLFSCSIATAPSPSPSSSPSPLPLAPYIRRSCHRTLYPGLCYASLSPYADQVRTDPVLLARFAMNVTLTHLKPIAVRMGSNQAALAPSSHSNNGSKVKDCTGLVAGAMSLVKKSEKEVAGLESKVGPEVAWRISNAQTWLSAAITDEETCIDEFGLGVNGDIGDGRVEEDVEIVCRKLRRAEHLTSNALALINGLVNS